MFQVIFWYQYVSRWFWMYFSLFDSIDANGFVGDIDNEAQKN